MRCRGGDSRARLRTPDPYRLSLKWHAPIASVAALSERHADWQLLRYAFCGVKLSDLSLRGGQRPTWQSREGSCVFADSFPTMRPGTARLPRRFAPRNDTSGERGGAPVPSCGLIPLYKALAERHADWQLLRYAFCGVKLSDLSLRGPTGPWRPEREARGSALGVQSREGTSKSQKSPGENANRFAGAY